MNSTHSGQDTGAQPVVITRVAQHHWHALADDRVVGRGHASRRPDGRLFVSADAWHTAVFDRIVDAMLTDLPTPLYTVVDEADADLTSSWERAGFVVRRREWEYVVPTDPRATGLESVRPPSGVTIVPAGTADEGRLRELDGAVRAEIEATVGWDTMPAEVLLRPHGSAVLDLSQYVAAALADRYVGLVRLTLLTWKQPRIGLIAVRSDQRRRGVGGALLAHVLGTLHDAGIAMASADVHESNAAALALFDGVGARRASSNLELVLG